MKRGTPRRQKKYHCNEFAQGEKLWCCESAQRYSTGLFRQTGESTMPLRSTETGATIDPSFEVCCIGVPIALKCNNKQAHMEKYDYHYVSMGAETHHKHSMLQKQQITLHCPSFSLALVPSSAIVERCGRGDGNAQQGRRKEKQRGGSLPAPRQRSEMYKSSASGAPQHRGHRNSSA